MISNCRIIFIITTKTEQLLIQHLRVYDVKSRIVHMRRRAVWRTRASNQNIKILNKYLKHCWHCTMNYNCKILKPMPNFTPKRRHSTTVYIYSILIQVGMWLGEV